MKKSRVRGVAIGACLAIAYVSPAGADEIEGIIWNHPPSVSPDNYYLQRGYLDATLYGADPTGVNDSTISLQNAAIDARDYQLVLFLPSGDYKISDTIKGVMESDEGGVKREFPTQILGSRIGGGATIRLADNAPGFQNPQNPKAMIHFFAVGNDAQKTVLPTGSNYNHTLRNVRVLIGAGNQGAVGVQMGTAQGALLEDVSISSVDNAPFFAGVYDTPAQGGGTFNLEVIGGQYGAYLTRKSRFPLIVGCRFKGQSVAGVRHEHGMPLVVAGSHFDQRSGVNGIELYQDLSPPRAAGVTVVDTVFRLKRGAIAILNPERRNVYLKNVYFQPGVIAAQNGTSSWTVTATTHAREYSYTPPHETTRLGESLSSHLIDGALGTGERVDSVPLSTVPKYATVRARHTWASHQNIPSFEDADTVNAKDYGVRGDGSTDDTLALQSLIDDLAMDRTSSNKIFLPKGIYRIKNIVLRANTKLFGVSRYYTVLFAVRDSIANPNRELVSTDDAATGTGSLSFMHIVVNNKSATRNHHLVWRLGRNSMVHNVNAEDWEPGMPKTDTKAFWVQQSGGGRWYAAGQTLRELSGDVGFRTLYVDRTREPLSIYGYYAEDYLTEPMSEVVGAENVRFFYFKTEADVNNKNTTLRIADSTNVGVFGMFGSVDLRDTQKAIVEARDSNDVLIAQVRSWSSHAPDATWFSLKEILGSATAVVSSEEFVNVYKRGDFDSERF